MSHLSSRNRGLRSRQHGRYSILEVRVWGHSEPSDHKPEPECQLHHRSGRQGGQDVGEQALDTKDSDWMLLRLLLQLASTHLSWTGGHSCPSLCRHGLGLPCKHPIPEHQWSSLYSYLTWKTSSCLTLNDRGGVRKCSRDPSSLEPSSVASLQKWDWNCLGVLYSGF